MSSRETEMYSSGIIRVKKVDHWVTVNKEVFNDLCLSWAARGVMGYLLTKPDNWEVRVTDLIKRSTAGRDAIYTILKNLRACGYVRRVRLRLAGEDSPGSLKSMRLRRICCRRRSPPVIQRRHHFRVFRKWTNRKWTSRIWTNRIWTNQIWKTRRSIEYRM